MSAPTNRTVQPPFDQTVADSYVGKVILVGITYVDHLGKELRHQQLHGVIERASPQGILISLRGAHQGGSWNMPPDLQAIRPANPGIYTLHSTGEDVANPDLVATLDHSRTSKTLSIVSRR
jgi:hypothetical protein